MYKKQSLPDVAFVYLNRVISLGDDRFTAGLSKSMSDTTIERTRKGLYDELSRCLWQVAPRPLHSQCRSQA